MENNTVKKKNNDFVDKNITKPTKKIYKNDCWSLIRKSFRKWKCLKKEVMLTIEITVEKERRKELMKTYCYEKKKINMNYLINHVEELENAWISW